MIFRRVLPPMIVSCLLMGCNNSQNLLIDSASPELLNNYFLYSNEITIIDGSRGFNDIAKTVEIKPDPEDVIWGKLLLNKNLDNKSTLAISAAQILHCDHPEDASNALRCNFEPESAMNWFEIRQANNDEEIVIESADKQTIAVTRDQIVIRLRHQEKSYLLIGQFKQI